MKKSLTILFLLLVLISNAQRGIFSSHNNEGNRVVQSQQPPFITAGLIQNLDANNSTSYGGTGSIWTDIVGGNNGTITGGTFTTSGGVSFFNFPTANVPSYVSAPLAKTPSMTFSIWAKGNSATVPGCMLFNAGFAAVGPDLFFSGGGIYWNVWDGGNTPFRDAGNATVSTSIAANTNWHNYTVVVDEAGNNAKLYFDGVWMGTSTYRSPTASTALFIGSAGINSGGINDASWNWLGGISIFQSYNRALSASEVTANFNALKSRFGFS